MSMWKGENKSYNVAIIGCGPAGIFTAYELINKGYKGKILMIDKGKDINHRVCPMREKPGSDCVNCSTCSIMSGFGGAGAFSDCKLSLYPINVGGNIADYVGEDEAIDLAIKVDNIFTKYDKDAGKREVIGDPESYKKAKEEFCTGSGQGVMYGQTLELNFCPTKHLGTDGTLLVMHEMFEALNKASNVEFMFNSEVKKIDYIYSYKNYEFDVYDNSTKKCVTVTTSKLVLAPGRVGNSWMKHVANRLGIKVKSGSVDIGVRVETDASITDEVTDKLYDMKFFSHDPCTGYKVRTFCTNPKGFVSEEKYNGCAVVNGHSFANTKSNKTNFAILVNITDENFKSEDAVQFMNFVNSYSDGKPIITNAVDFIYSNVVDRITQKMRDKIENDYTLQSAKPAKFGNLYPSSVYDSIANFMRLLDSSCMHGLCGPKTWLYGPEIKFYSNTIECDEHFETKLPGLYCIGDGAGITRGIIQSAASGLVVADHIVDNK